MNTPALLALALAPASCKPVAFACERAEQCVGAGPAAACEPDGYCSVADEVCASGRRYSEHAGPRSNECVAVPATETAGDASGETSGSSTTTTSTSGTTTESSSTSPGPDPTSSSGSDDSTGAPDPQPLLWFAFEDELTDGFDNGGRLGAIATCTGDGCPTKIEGPVGSAAQFDGVDDCGVFAFVPELNTYEAFSIAAWIRRDVVGSNYDAILAKPVGQGAYNTWRLAVQAFDMIDTIHVHVGLADNSGAELNPVLGSVEWVHAVATWDGATLALWIDGAIFDTIASPLIEWDEQAVFVGCDDDHTGTIGGFFLGGIDELRLYGRVLASEEIVGLASP